ncbi:pectinesterase [Typha angustifolia]|uniref:pectinesterase n=1 Tax=Typha angustifolia TaxID=59011 RepID=UPI003C2DB563
MPPLTNKSKLLLFSPLLLLLLVLLSTIPFRITPQKAHQVLLHHHSHFQKVAASRHCDGTLYPDLCVSTLLSIPNLAKKTLPEVICSAVHRTASAVRSSASNCTSYLRHVSLDGRERLALLDCLDLFDQSLDELQSAIVDLGGTNSSSYSYSSAAASRSVAHVVTVLSAAMTNQYTCLDGFTTAASANVRPYIQGRLHHVVHLVSNSLAMVKRLPRRFRGREALEGYGGLAGGFPRWVSGGDRKLLQSAANITKVDLVVAKDGSGNFTTVSAAVAAAPNNSDTRFIIYIKAGGYFENVEVGKSKTNLMFIGDGIGKTVIKASRNVVDGWTTFRSATLAVVGNGFLARDITIENSAGASKHQAVALRTGSDLSAFYRCSFVGYQDTLYVHSLRQFYRECDIYGTVDFVFGDAAVVLQNCNLYARKPDPNQKNVFTAQGREDPNQNTGIVIQKCKVTAAADLIPVQSNFPTFLGRPWKQYSRTVYMQSFLDSLIDPKGWLEWNGNFALDTLYYGEYMNRGPGSNTADRVTWPGYHVINSSVDASNFTVAAFIQGDQWLGATSFPFTAGL